MRNKPFLSFILVFMMIFSLAVPAFAATDGVTFGVRFNKTEYGVGETAVATVYVKGLTADVTLGGLETELSFVSTDMDYVSGSFADAVVAASPDESNIGSGTRNGKNILRLFMVDSDGIAVRTLDAQATANTEIVLATLSFTVKKNGSSRVSLGFEEDSIFYSTEIFDSNLIAINYSFTAPAVASVKDFVFLETTPVKTPAGVTVSPAVCTASAMMFAAKLSDADGNLLAAPYFAYPEANKQTTCDITFAYTGPTAGTKITYYFWGIGAGLMKPVQKSVSVSLTE
ncbi:MAG: hypothetical protein E7390_03805 [Ruminococcaceae bacterium]|nr:hypothetical protein [Oscillospiraceae bacterium]